MIRVESELCRSLTGKLDAQEPWTLTQEHTPVNLGSKGQINHLSMRMNQTHLYLGEVFTFLKFQDVRKKPLWISSMNDG